jgi:hypothetical protein
MSDDKSQKIEDAQVAKYGDKIVLGTVKQETEGHLAGKYSVEIYTKGKDGKPDGGKRRVATSDVFQTHHTEEVAAELRRERLVDKRAAKKAAAAPKAAKAPKAPKAAKAPKKAKAQAAAV